MSDTPTHDSIDPEYTKRVDSALADIRTFPVAGSLAFDLVTRQLLFVRQKAYENLAEHYAAEGYDLATYGPHPYLPVRVTDAVYECYYVNDLSLDGLEDVGSKRDYDFPEGRLAVVPVENAWRDGGVADV